MAQNGFGAAAAEVKAAGGYNLVGTANPANAGDIPMLFVTGLGSVAPSLRTESRPRLPASP